MSAYPTTIIEQVCDLLKAETSARVEFYAGEFFDLDEVERLAKDVRSRPYFFVDLEDMIPLDATGRQNKDRLMITVYACASNKRDEQRQQQMSYELANAARKFLVGREITGTANEHSNGFLKYGNITKELQTFGLSVHALSLYVDINYNLDS